MGMEDVETDIDVGLDNLRREIDKLEEAKRVGLKINTAKTKNMRINARNQEKIKINGQDIEETEEFTYLGATVCKEGGGMKDLKNRLLKARGAFIKLKKIWSSKAISRRTKLRLYKTLVV